MSYTASEPFGDEKLEVRNQFFLEVILLEKWKYPCGTKFKRKTQKV